MKDFVLTIDSNTFIWTQRGEGLAYNSLNFKSIKFKVFGIIKEICEKLNKPENLYSVFLSKAEADNPYVKIWIRDMLSIESAIFKPYNEDITASLKPMLKVQNNINKIVNNHSCSDIIDCLREVTFHLTGTNIDNEEMEYHKQFLYPTISKKHLKYNELTDFLNFIPKKGNVTLNFIGDCDFYPKIKDLSDLLSQRENFVTFYFRLEDIHRIWNNIHNLIDKYNICLLCKVNEHIKENLSFALKNIPNAYFQFLIGSEEENNFIETIDTNKFNYTIVPVFTGNNHDFFSRCIYLENDDCANIKMIKRYIFINQALNGNFFGKLEILPDGSVWDNLNFQKVGFINDSFSKLLFSVFDNKKAWFYNRHQYPCTHCLYQWLCPPPSNYELVLNKPNLCHVKS